MHLQDFFQIKPIREVPLPRDFVELPSQIMEHWVLEPEVLKVYAKHYQTGEIIPTEIVDKLEKSGKFNTGFITVEYRGRSFAGHGLSHSY